MNRKVIVISILVVLILLLVIGGVVWYFVLNKSSKSSSIEYEEITLTITHPVGISYNLEIDGKDHFGVLYYNNVIGRKVTIEKKANHTFQLVNATAPRDMSVQWTQSKNKILELPHQSEYSLSLEMAIPTTFPERKCRVQLHGHKPNTVIKFTDANDKKFELTFDSNGEINFVAAFHVETFDDFNQTNRRLFMPFTLSEEQKVCEQAFLDVTRKTPTKGNVLTYAQEWPLQNGGIAPHHLYICEETNHTGVQIIFDDLTSTNKKVYYVVDGKYYEQPLTPDVNRGQTEVSWWVVPVTKATVITLTDGLLGGVGGPKYANRNYKFATGDPTQAPLDDQAGHRVYYLQPI